MEERQKYHKEFRFLISNARKGMRMTKRKLAKELNVHFTYMTRIENGSDLPSVEMAGKIADLLMLNEKMRRDFFKALLNARWPQILEAYEQEVLLRK